jgi:anti-sigma regulatory factor (Ser/Thr protein kinase)
VVLTQLDAVAAHIPGASCTTVFLAVLDTEARTVRYSSAGHLPAVRAAPHSPATLLADAQSVPLAVQSDHSRPQAAEPLMAGSTLMLFTDGLVERHGEAIDDGITRVADILVETMNLPVDAVADTVLRDLAPPCGYDDDVALVVCQPPQQPLRVETGASADRLAEVRHRFTAWLQAAGVPEPLATDMLLAINEACTNSVEHAYSGHVRPGRMLVHAQLHGSEVQVRAVDFGSWKTPPADPGTRGRGLPLIRAVADRVQVECTPAGTTIDMTFSLQTPRPE